MVQGRCGRNGWPHEERVNDGSLHGLLSVAGWRRGVDYFAPGSGAADERFFWLFAVKSRQTWQIIRRFRP